MDIKPGVESIFYSGYTDNEFEKQLMDLVNYSYMLALFPLNLKLITNILL